jgi:hypothetical protein
MLELLQHQALWVLTMHRNGAHDGPESVLTFDPESLLTIDRNGCSRCAGIRIQTWIVLATFIGMR